MNQTTLIALAGLVLSCSVHAAGVDCAKARTQVEKRTCKNTELSKFNENLAVVRAKLYVQSSERHENAAGKNIRVESRWDMQWPAARVERDIEVISLQDGDFLIRRIRRFPDEPLAAITFFGGKVAKSIDPATTEPAFVEFVDGIRVKRSTENVQDLPRFSAIENVWISEDDAWRTVPSEGCYFGPLSHNIRLSRDKFALRNDDFTKAIAVFKISKKPKNKFNSGCMYEPDEKLKIRLESMQMDGAWPLQDGGFLVLLDRKVVIRFDKNLETKSNLVGHSLFIAKTPIELIGSQSAHLLGMPVLTELDKECKNGKTRCSVQFLHDELSKRLLNSTKRIK